MGRLGVAIVGCGHMGRILAEAIVQDPLARLEVVCDIDGQAAAAIGSKYGVSWTTSLDAFLEKPRIDAVIVATPDDRHVEPCIRAARAGKHLLVEKPLAANAHDARAILNAAEDAGTRVMVGHSLRFDPRFIMAVSSVQQGSVGHLTEIASRRAAPVEVGLHHASHATVLTFLASHEVDAFNWVTGRRPEAVYARGRRAWNTQSPQDETVSAILEYPGNVIVSMQVGWALPPVSGPRTNPWFEVTGDEGSIRIEGHQHGLVLHNKYSTDEPNVFYNAEVYGRRIGIYVAEVQHFVRALLEDKPFAVTGEDGLRVMEVVDAMSRSLELGSRVPL